MERKINKYLGLIIFVLGALLLVIKYLTNDVKLMEILYNTDALYLPSLYKDIIVNGNNFSDWNLTPAPYFFPDMLVYFILNSFLNFYYSILGMLLFQYLSFLFGIYLLFREFFKKENSFFLSCFLTVLIFTIEHEFQYIALSNTYHFGEFLVGIFLMKLVLMYLRNERDFLLIVKLILVSWTVASDKLFIIHFLLPIIFTLILLCFFKKVKRKTHIKLILIIAFSTAIGYWLHDLIIVNPVEYSLRLKLNYFSTNIEIIIETLTEYWQQNKFMCITYILTLVGILYQFFNKLKLKVNMNKNFLFLFLFMFFSTLITIVVTSFISITPTERYWFNLFYFPFILFLLNIKRELVLTYKNKIITSFFILLLFLNSVLALDFSSVKFKYYPNDVECFDSFVLKTKAKTGIAQYWQAKRFFLLSSFPVEIASKNNDLSDRMLITSKKWYKKEYDFALVDHKAIDYYKLKKDRIFQSADPSLTVRCDSIDFIYFKDKLNFIPFSKIEKPLTWLGKDLWSKTGKRVEDYIQAIPGRDKKGHITYGPAIPIPSGEYEFELTYSSLSPNKLIVNFWDIYLTRNDGETLRLRKGELKGTNDSKTLIRESFKIPEEFSNSNIEIRNKFLNTGELTIYQLRITKKKN